MAHVVDSKQVLLVTFILLGAVNLICYLKNRRVDKMVIIKTLFVVESVDFFL